MNNFPVINGIYVGIVVQNNDPEQRGRCKVFIPHVNLQLYKKWNEIAEDKRWKFIGRNIDSDLSDILDDLKRMLPWAEQAHTLTSEDTSGRYNSFLNIGTISDSSKLNSTFSNLSSSDIDPSKITPYSQNLDNIGENTGNRYDTHLFRANDAFNNAKENKTINVNPYSYNYKPETLSNTAKGLFGVPNVGAHVWCFFHDGSPMNPVFFAASFGKQDWHGIYECDNSNHGLDYPGIFENKSLSARDINTETYRSKFVINQKGGVFQIINTDNREAIKITHFSGSFKEFNNYTNIEFASNNDQKLVVGDKFSTVRGSQNIFIGRESDLNIKGDSYRKVGNLNIDVVNQWKQITSEIADTKQLFELKRAESITNSLLKVTSSKQSRKGSFAPCPVCKGTQAKYWRLNSKFISTGISISNNEVDGPYLTNSVNPVGQQVPPDFNTYGGNGVIFGSSCPSCKGTGISTSSMDGTWQKEFEKDKLQQVISSKIVKLAKLEEQMGLGGSEIIDITKHKFETVGLVMNDFGSIRVDNVGKIFNSELIIGVEGVFANKVPTPLIEYVHVDDLPGGNYNLNVCNKYTVQVGAGGISFKSYGPVNLGGTITNIVGEQVNLSSGNEVNIDGGKRLTLTGDVVVIKQRNKKQVLVDSTLGVNKNLIVGGGCHIEGELTVNHITAPTEIQQTEQNVVFSAAVPKRIIGYGTAMLNTTAGGRAYIGKTDSTTIIGYVNIGGNDHPVFGSDNICIYGASLGLGGESVGTLPIVVYGTGRDENSIQSYPHSHNFKNIPLTLVPSNDDVRKRAKLNNLGERQPADPIVNTKK